MNAHPTPQPGAMPGVTPGVDPVVKSMVAHPAGRRYAGTRPDGRPAARPTAAVRESVRIPGAVSCHGPRYDQTVGHVRVTRDAAPGDLAPAAWVLMEIMAVLVVLCLVGVVLRLVWQGLGPVGLASVGLAVVLALAIHHGVRGEDR